MFDRPISLLESEVGSFLHSKVCGGVRVGRTELGKEHSGGAAAESDSGKGLAGAQFRNDAVTSGREKQVKVTAALAISALVRVLATFK